MIPAIYNLPDAYRGDTYGPITFRFTDASGNPIMLNGMRACLQFRNKRTNDVALTWDSVSGSQGIMLISGNVVTMNPMAGINMEIDPNTYAYDLQIMSGDTFVKTYIRGDVTVIRDVTDVTE
jgi:hypothetical protein